MVCLYYLDIPPARPTEHITLVARTRAIVLGGAAFKLSQMLAWKLQTHGITNDPSLLHKFAQYAGRT